MATYTIFGQVGVFSLSASAAALTYITSDISGDITGLANQEVAFGNTVTWTAVVSGSSTPPYTYDWYSVGSGLLLAGDLTGEYTVPASDSNNGEGYYFIVRDAVDGQGTSATGTLTVAPANLKISWSVTDAATDTTVTTDQTITWSVEDGRTAGQQAAFTCPVRTHRGLNDDGSTYWIPFYDLSARCSRGPLVNDLYNRYYWTQDGQDMKYSPLGRLKYDYTTTGLNVGVPAPLAAPIISAPAAESDSEIVVDRAYVYTYVTVYGEEGPPSPPTVASGVDGGTWGISGMSTGPDDGKLRSVTRKNIYRTVSKDGIAEYHFIASVAIQATAYDDALSVVDAGLNYTLESEGWQPPPDNLEGLIEHPNGFFVGFVGRDIYFSEPYRPHAWPIEYVLSTTGDIIGFGIFDTTVVICTNSHPYTVTGINPRAMVLQKHDTAEPCLSRYGIVSMPFGVYYPGPNGLTLASPQGIVNATKNLMTKEEWQNRYDVYAFDAARYQSQYVAFYNSTQGLMFAPDEPMAALVDLELTGTDSDPDSLESIFTDEYSGKTFILDNCSMYEWNPVSGAPLDYDWTSMEFDAPEPVNLGAGRIIWYSRYTPPDATTTQLWRDYNVARMADSPLNPLNHHALNTVRQENPVGYETFIEMKQPVAWSPLIWVPGVGEDWPNTPFVIMDLIANETVIYSKAITHTKMFRLPTGYKATRYRIRLRSNIPIQSVKLAETGKELAAI